MLTLLMLHNCGKAQREGFESQTVRVQIVRANHSANGMPTWPNTGSVTRQDCLMPHNYNYYAQIVADSIWTTVSITLQDSWWWKCHLHSMFLQSSKCFIEIVTKEVPDIIPRPKFQDFVTNSKTIILSCFYHLQFLRVLTDLGSIRQINTARSLSNSASLKDIYWPRCGQTRKDWVSLESTW